MEVHGIRVKPTHDDRSNADVRVHIGESESDDGGNSNEKISDKFLDSSENFDDHANRVIPWENEQNHAVRNNTEREKGTVRGNNDLKDLHISTGESSSVPKNAAWVEIPIEDDDDDNALDTSDSTVTTVVTAASRDDDESNAEESQDAVSGVTNTADNSIQVNQSNGKEDDVPDIEPIHQVLPEPRGLLSYLTKFISRVKRVRNRKIHPEKCEVYVIPSDDSFQPSQSNDSTPGGYDNCCNPSRTDEISLRESGPQEHKPDPFLVSPPDDESRNTEQDETKWALYYLFVYLFWICMYPKKLTGKKRLLHWIPFILISLAATFEGVLSIKQEFDSAEDPLLRLIGLGYYINALLLRLYFQYLVIFKLKKIKELFRLLASFGTFPPRSKVALGVALLLVSSILMAILFFFAITAEILDGEDYNLADMIQWQAFVLSESVLVWNREAGGNTTALLAKEFGGNFTAKAFGVGITGSVIKISGYTYSLIIRDICIVLAVTICGLTTIFIGLLNFEAVQTEEEHAQIWEFYKKLQALSKLTEDEFGILLQFAHVHNILFCSYFSFESFMEEPKWYVSLVQLCIFLKVAYFYLKSAKTSRVNPKFRSWIHKFCTGIYTPFVENGGYVTTQILLDQLKESPIGVGSSLFYIDYSFIWRFITFVSSYFFFFAQHSSN